MCHIPSATYSTTMNCPASQLHRETARDAHTTWAICPQQDLPLLSSNQCTYRRTVRRIIAAPPTHLLLADLGKVQAWGSSKA